MAGNYVRFFYVFTFFSKSKTRDFLPFCVTCCTHFLEQWSRPWAVQNIDEPSEMPLGRQQNCVGQKKPPIRWGTRSPKAQRKEDTLRGDVSDTTEPLDDRRVTCSRPPDATDSVGVGVGIRTTRAVRASRRCDAGCRYDYRGNLV